MAPDFAATEALYPRIEGDVIFRLAYDYDYKTDARTATAQDVALKMEARPSLQVSETFGISSEIRLENAGPPSDNRYFEEQALFVRKLFMLYDPTDQLSLYAGKLTPAFAFFSLNIPGMYGNSYSKEIELIERVGLGGDYRISTGTWRHTLSAVLFFEDTSILSDSLITNRGRTDLEDGGASNTETLESLTLALEGTTPAPGFTYRIAYLREAAGAGDVGDEEGVLIAAKQTIDLAGGRSLDMVGEFSALSQFEGSADDIMYISGGLSYATGPWRGTLSGTYRPRDLATGGVFEDYSLQTALSYSIRDDLALEVAHEFTRDRDDTGQRVGLRLNKTIDLRLPR
ncbi:MAG: hypothetical protein AAGI50_18830 [Pseudomonadota bacterium]